MARNKEAHQFAPEFAGLLMDSRVESHKDKWDEIFPTLYEGKSLKVNNVYCLTKSELGCVIKIAEDEVEIGNNIKVKTKDMCDPQFLSGVNFSVWMKDLFL